MRIELNSDEEGTSMVPAREDFKRMVINEDEPCRLHLAVIRVISLINHLQTELVGVLMVVCDGGDGDDDDVPTSKKIGFSISFSSLLHEESCFLSSHSFGSSSSKRAMHPTVRDDLEEPKERFNRFDKRETMRGGR